MAGAILEVRGEELTKLNARLGTFFARVKKPAEGMKVLASTLVSQTKGRILDERTSPEGVAWKAWTAKYKKSVLKKGGSRDLLQAEGNLWKDLSPDHGDDFAQAYTSMIYGRIHQAGSPATDKNGRDQNIPARPYLGLSPDNAAELESVFSAWVEAQL